VRVGGLDDVGHHQRHHYVEHLRGGLPSEFDEGISEIWNFVHLSHHTTHTIKAERRAEKQRQRLAVDLEFCVIAALGYAQIWSKG